MRPGRLLVLAALLACAAAALSGVPLDVRPGLWEVGMTRESQLAAPAGAATADDPANARGGRAPTPEQTPDPAPRLAASAARHAPRKAQPELYQYCVTQKDLERARFGGATGAGCTRTLVRGTTRHVEYTFECSGEEGNGGSGTLRFDASDREHLSGVVAVTVSSGASETTTAQHVEAKWLSESCGDVRGRKRILKSTG